jgi:hypothetical protein
MQTSFLPGRYRDILLLVFSLLAILGLAGWGVYEAIAGFVSLDLASRADLASGLLSACSMFSCAGLLVPLLVYCVRKVRGQEILQVRVLPIRFLHLAELIGVWVIIVVLASIVNNVSEYGAIISAPFFLLGIALPIAGLVWIAIGGLAIGSRRRVWAAFGIGMAGSTF